MFEITQKQLSFKGFQHTVVGDDGNWGLFQEDRIWVLFPLAMDVEFLFLEEKQQEVKYVLLK